MYKNWIELNFDGSRSVYRDKFPTDHEIDHFQKLSEVLNGDAKQIMKESYEDQTWFKCCIGARVVFRKADNETIITEPPPYFQTLPLESYTILRERIDNYEEMGSGWVLDHFKCIVVQIVEMANPLGGNKKWRGGENINAKEEIQNRCF